MRQVLHHTSGLPRIVNEAMVAKRPRVPPPVNHGSTDSHATLSEAGDPNEEGDHKDVRRGSGRSPEDA